MNHKMPYQPASAKAWLIQPCTVADAPALGRNNTSAFWEEPMWRPMWPADVTLEYVTEQLTKRSPMRLLQDPHKMRHQKAVDPDTGELVGYCRWELPLSRQTGKGSTEGGEQDSGEGQDSVRNDRNSDDGTVEWPEAVVPAVSKEDMKRFQEMQRTAWWHLNPEAEKKDELDDINEGIKKRIVEGREFMVLDYLAVHPSNKGRGIATALVQRGIEQAERMGLPIFIHAWKSARGLYLRLGFEEVAGSIQDGSGEKYGFGTKDYNVYFMVYEPRSKGG